MVGQTKGKRALSRRTFLKGMRWAPVLFLPAPLQALPFQRPTETSRRQTASFPFSDFRVTPHYPSKSPLDDIFRLVVPGTDEYVAEGYAFELMARLGKWSQELKAEPPAIAALSTFVDSAIESTALIPIRESPVRAGNGIDVVRREFAPALFPAARDSFGRSRPIWLHSSEWKLPTSRSTSALG